MRLPVFFIVGLLAGLVIPTESRAATQGEWGRTSTATVKITLRIPERNQSASTVSTPNLTNGQQALDLACKRLHTKLQPLSSASAFQITAVNPGYDLPLLPILASRCQNQPIALKPHESIQTATLLIAPL